MTESRATFLSVNRPFDEALYSDAVIEGFLATPPSDRVIFEHRLNARQQREFCRAVFQYRNRMGL